MKKAPIPKNEKERLEDLLAYDVLDTSSEKSYDELTRLASLICGTKIALISLIDEKRQWFKSRVGLDAEQTPRDISYCGHAIMGEDLFIVEDAEKDERFCDNPLFLGAPHVRFYAGAPLITPRGNRIGTLCVIDSEKKTLDITQKMALKLLAKNVVTMFELSLRNRSLVSISNELKESNQYLELALECTNLGIWDWYIPEDVVRVDHRWESLFHLQGIRDKVNWNQWMEGIHPSDKNSYKKEIQDFVLGHEEYHKSIYRRKTEEGSWIYLLEQGKVTERDDKGRASRITGTHLDITEKIILQKQLSHQTRLASLGELAAGVGHEINNPLTIVKGYVAAINRLLENDGLSNEQLRTYLLRIDKTSDRISRVVKGLRTFSRMDSDTVEVFDILEALDESVAMVDEIYKKEGFWLLRPENEKREGVIVNGSRGRIQQVFLNLIVNAKDATLGRSKRELSISTKIKNGQLSIFFKDTGPGVSEEVRNQIFTPFFTTKEVNKGTGLGLSYANSIVGEHGGAIHLEEAAPGEGACFRMDIPIYEFSEGMEKKEEDSSSIFKLSKTCKCLVVDDEKEIRDYLRVILQDLGCEVETASDGKDALKKLFAKPDSVQLIISDVKMPEMDGLELSIKVKENFPAIKLVLVTGGTSLDLGKKKLEGGVIDGYFYKPFSVKKILETLEQTL